MQKNESSADGMAIESEMVDEYRKRGYSARVIEIEAGNRSNPLVHFEIKVSRLGENYSIGFPFQNMSINEGGEKLIIFNCFRYYSQYWAEGNIKRISFS